MTMKKIKVLLFAADPLSAPPDVRVPRLMLDEDVRLIQEKVRAAEYRDELEFVTRWATRPDDLLQALLQSPPQVVHFSGHGGSDGLVLVGSDGRSPHFVDAATLARLFRAFRGNIRVVLLNACFSLPQAEAIAAVVGCAIGTRSEISDKGAILFGASFYRSVAFGMSVQDAFEQACVALALEHVDEREHPQLVVAPGVDASQLFLIEPVSREAAAPVSGGETRAAIAAPTQESSAPLKLLPATSKRGMSRSRKAAGGLVAGGTVLLAILNPPDWPPMTCEAPADSVTGPVVQGIMDGRPQPIMTEGATPGVPSELREATALYRSGNYAAAVPLFQTASNAGNLEARGYLGLAYLHGHGVRRDTARGLDLLRKAAYSREVHAMNALGVVYRDGDGTDRNPHSARKWLGIAADSAGYAEAMHNLGIFNRDNHNYDSAAVWFDKAAKAGWQDARVDLGELRERGLGGSKSLREAVRMYHAAAVAGSARGMMAMGRICQNGTGVGQNYKRAKEWYLHAVAAGSVEAMNSIGILYQNGWGVKRDKDEAIRWFRKARDAGSTIAAANLASVGAK